MRKVADTVGISATAIYRHFDNRETLVLAICEEGFRRFGEYLYRGLRGETPLERLVLSGQGYLNFALEQRSYYEAMFMTPPRQVGLDRLEKRAQDELSPTFRFLVDRVRECMEAGDLLDTDPVATAVTIWCHCHGLVSLQINGQLGAEMSSKEAFRPFFTASVDILLRGLKARD